VLVESHDAEAFSRALDYLIGNQELRERMGERGREFVAQNYSVERLMADVLSLYEELLSPAGRRDVSRAGSPGTNQNISRAAGAARLKGD
ncbi:MAG: glycosyltransferase, partial [Acidobacteria bacterium]|nr:glycosyltransferase [Acidobacteriota bacterium]